MKKRLILPALLFMFALIYTGCEKDSEAPADSTRVDVTKDITVNTTWVATKVYYINDVIEVRNGATLTIEPGTVIKFSANGVFEVGYGENATLIAVGSVAAPIIFTSDLAKPTPGAWNYIYFGENTLQNTKMSYCIVEYAGKEDYYGAMMVDGCRIAVNNCTFRKNGGTHTVNVLLRDEGDGFVSFAGNTLADNSGHAISIPCEYVHNVSSDNSFTCAPGYGVEISGNFSQPSATLNKLTVPYYVSTNFSISVEGSLTIAAGVEMRFGGNSFMEVWTADARINAVGTATDRIIFTTSASSPAAGAWLGLVIEADAAPNCVLSYCDFRYAGKDSNYKGALNIRERTVTVSNCNFSNSQQWGIYLMDTGALTTGSTGNIFTACASGNTGTDN